MEIIIRTLSINLASVIILLLCGWIYSLIKKNVTIADSLWGLGFMIIAWRTFYVTDGYIGRKIMILTLVSIWGLRLFLYITKRGIGKGEDPRYGEWRKQYGRNFWLVSLFKVFLVQALFMWMISLSLQFGQIASSPDYLTFLDFTGMAIWIIGFLCESFADLQLSRFLADPKNKGRIMNQKLWKYSRHPNYFGESTMWWGIYIIACSTSGGVFTFISPVLITYTLLRLTGVTLMEKTRFGDNPEYKEYVRRTSSFIPWFPKKQA
jgi:steroid 5-alpha reductase family enzyme